MSLRDYLFYEEPGITLYCGDCRDVLPMLEPVDLVIADPPYNAGIAYESHDDAMPDYADWCASWFAQLRAARIAIFPGHGNLPVWWAIRKPSGVLCWYKPGNPKGGAVINFCEWEPILYWGKFLGGSDVFRATVSEQADAVGHPVPKPRKLIQTMLQRMRAEIVCDPFSGSGSTLHAAKNIGRRAIGIEIEPKYCEIAVRRLRQEVLL